MKKVYLIGTGTNGTNTLTFEAAEAIRNAEILIGASRMLKPYADTEKQIYQAYQPEQITAIIESASENSAAILLSGDCSFFSGASKLLALTKRWDVTVIPGISSLSAFCAKCCISYENMQFITLHGTDGNIAVYAKMNQNCFFLLGGNMDAAAVCSRLCEYGLSHIQVHIGWNLGYENETILHGTPSDFTGTICEHLSIMITENKGYLRYIPSAIPDSDFIREKVPMTKAEIRCNAVAALHIPHDAVCWDIGCGTGSVSVEMGFRCPDGQVYAFDRNPSAVQLTAQNAHKFACDHIHAIAGSCPDILQNYPAPEAVFIGGASGKIKSILNLVETKNPSAAIAMTVISIETLLEAKTVLDEKCIQTQISQIAVTRTKTIGSHTMPDTLNPVWLITGRLKCSV